MAEKKGAADSADAVTPRTSDNRYSRTAYERFDPTLYKRLHHDGRLVTRALGAFALLFLWAVWTGGCFSIFWWPWLVFKGYHKTALVTGFILAYPYIFKVKQSPAFIRFILLGAGWCEGGATFLMEEEMKKVDTSHHTFLAMHPHGIFPLGFFLNGGASRVHARNPEVYVPSAFAHMEPRSTGLVEPILFQIPLIRHFLLAFGCSDPATKRRMKELLSKGVSVGLLPGGSEEIILSQHGHEKLYIRKRKGFIKLHLWRVGLVQGCDVGSASARGLPQVHQDPALLRVGHVVVHFPSKKGLPLETVIGNPIVLPHIPEPTAEDVDKWHAVYLDKLTDLFERNKANFGYANRQLELY